MPDSGQQLQAGVCWHFCGLSWGRSEESRRFLLTFCIVVSGQPYDFLREQCCYYADLPSACRCITGGTDGLHPRQERRFAGGGFQSCGLELSAMCALSVDQGIYCLSLSFFPGYNYAASRGLKGPPRSGRSHYPGPIPDYLSFARYRAMQASVSLCVK